MDFHLNGFKYLDASGDANYYTSGNGKQYTLSLCKFLGSTESKKVIILSALCIIMEAIRCRKLYCSGKKFWKWKQEREEVIGGERER